MSYQIDEGAVVKEHAGVHLVDRIAHSMPHVVRSMRSRLVRGLRHHHTNPARRNRLFGKLQRRSATFAIAHDAIGKTVPPSGCLLADTEAFPGHVLCLPIHGVNAGPILHLIHPRARLAPIDTQGIQLLRGEQIEDDPLRMQSIIFAGKRLGKVRVALPKRSRISICEPPEAVLGAPI